MDNRAIITSTADGIFLSASVCRKTSIVIKNGVEGRSPQLGLGAVAPVM